ncbi:MAG TPA: hypothetical protein PKC49_06140 [Phycisphaerae bacterium]|nr:hypothetical protein [Phycisphaerae bacterium]
MAAMSDQLRRLESAPLVPDDAELRCPACGYDLRGLPRDGRCPECGGPVAAALAKSPLLFSDRVWLRRMFWGSLLVHASPLPVILTPAAVLLPGRHWSFGAFIGLLSLAFVLLLGGLWLATARNPALIERESAWSARRVTRVALLAALLGVAALATTLRPMPTLAAIAIILGLSPFGAPGVVLVISLSRYVEQLARAAGNRQALDRARVNRLAFSVAAALIVILLPLAAYRLGGEITRLLLVVAGAVALIFGLLTALLPGYLLRDLSRAP